MNLLPGRIVGPGTVETGGGRLAFAAQSFQVADGQAVEVGVRPEDLSFAAGGESGIPFAGEFVEELGATRLFHGTSGEAPIAVAVGATASSQPGASVTADAAAIHLFDAATGASLRRGV
jgi:sn-glycerol 3-phosphate transport system ATP-binding protein